MWYDNHYITVGIIYTTSGIIRSYATANLSNIMWITKMIGSNAMNSVSKKKLF